MRVHYEFQFKCLTRRGAGGGDCGRDKANRPPVCLSNILLLFAILLQVQGLIQVPNRHTVASIPGDLVIGILVPVHERPSSKQAQTRTCGPVREQYGIQRVEAAFKTIDSINADPNILPNITLGIEIRDSCWHSPIALEQSIEFIRDAMAASEQAPGSTPTGNAQSATNRPPSSLQTSPNSTALTGSSSDNSSSLCAPLLLRQQQQQLAQGGKKVKNIVGVVGPASSTDTVQVQNLLQLFNMPQVGYSSTSRDLSNKNFFKYFLRVVPSDKLQAQVMIDLMLAHNWTYITVAYTEGSYGSSLMNAFRERAQEVGVCFATLESMPPNADDSKFDELIDAIQKHPNARVVVCMCEGRTVGKLFAGLKRRNVTNEYLIVGSDGWSDRFDVVEKQEELALGGISIRIHSAYVHDFDDYYFALSPSTNHRNPWFAEFWETRFQCNLDLANQSNRPVLNSNQLQRPAFVRPAGAKIYNRTCTGRESLRNNHKQDGKMAFVQKSIITMALGLDSMQRSICGLGKLGLCPEMLPVNGSILLQHLMNVSFTFLNEDVWFDEQGDPPGKYEILNFQRRRQAADPQTGLQAPSSSAEEPPTALDYSIISANSLANDPPQNSRRPPALAHFDSYKTLKVHRVGEPQTGSRHLSRRSSFSGAGNRQIQQDSASFSPPASGYSSTSGYEYVHVGSWKSSDGLSLFGEIRWPNRLVALPADHHATSAPSTEAPFNGYNNTTGLVESLGLPTGSSVLNEMPRSVCSLPCSRGHAKKIQSDSVKCCWVCVPCRPNEYLFNEFKCRACDKGWWPNSLQTGCDQIPIQYLDWRNMEGLIAISIAIFGLMLTLATAIVFIRHNNTPVVKSSTRELSYMILFSMFLCYLNTFFLVAKPRKETCFVTRVLPGFAFAMLYGALVTKTNRIARILAGSKKKIITRRPRFMSATSQVVITWIIVTIECVIIVSMLVREPADKMHDFPSDDRVVLVCNTTTMGIIAPLGFDFFLIAMCTLYAFKTRNVPENFNEAKFIGFTMYTTLVIWVAFVVIYLSSDHKIITLCLCISFSALFALFLLFFPRCYIIIFKPEKNNRSFFTTTKNVRCHIGYQMGSSGAAAAAAAAANQSQYMEVYATTNNNYNFNSSQSANNSLDYDQYPYNYDQQQQQQQSLHRHQQKQQQQPLVAGSQQMSSNRASNWQWRQRVAILDASNGPSGLKRSDSGAREPGAQGNREPNRKSAEGLARSIFNGIFSAFARRSRRREKDKVSTIQQHLRAIRHAENLDRQTHFRRSQVQRLIQRFDSTTTNGEHLSSQASVPAKMSGSNNNWSAQQQSSGLQMSSNKGTDPSASLALVCRHSSRPAGGFLGSSPGLARQASLLTENRSPDELLLMMTLSQLIGAEQIRRLADMIKRHWLSRTANKGPAELILSGRQQAAPTLSPTHREALVVVARETSGPNQQAAKETNKHPQVSLELELGQLEDRQLAMAFLGCLAELARSSLSRLQSRASREAAGGMEQRNCFRPSEAIGSLPSARCCRLAALSRQQNRDHPDEEEEEEEPVAADERRKAGSGPGGANGPNDPISRALGYIMRGQPEEAAPARASDNNFNLRQGQQLKSCLEVQLVAGNSIAPHSGYPPLPPPSPPEGSSRPNCYANKSNDNGISITGGRHHNHHHHHHHHRHHHHHHNRNKEHESAATCREGLARPLDCLGQRGPIDEHLPGPGTNLANKQAGENYEQAQERAAAESFRNDSAPDKETQESCGRHRRRPRRLECSEHSPSQSISLAVSERQKKSPNTRTLACPQQCTSSPASSDRKCPLDAHGYCCYCPSKLTEGPGCSKEPTRRHRSASRRSRTVWSDHSRQGAQSSPSSCNRRADSAHHHDTDNHDDDQDDKL